MIKKIGLAIIIIMTSFMVYSLIEPYWIQTEEVTIESNQIPAQFDGKKIVFISDVHMGSWPFFDQERTQDLVNQVNGLHPDIILLGGDYVSDDPPYVNSSFTELSKLKAPLGVYCVLGNNDPRNESLEAIKNTNITYIGNTGLWMEYHGAKIRIGGVGDIQTDIQDQDSAVGDANENDFMILLSHNPDFFPLADKSKVDLMLSGHTHGGQITFFGIWAPDTHSQYGNKYRTGVIKENNSTLVVSNGIGTIMLPMRFFARPQIVVIDLKRT
ncbi:MULTISPECIES: metallophosphoesterase [Methanobacterium]|jgi:predicted MPP superfamily phosphohydrolase|uniref:Metallophosphoesterase n=1 Tax=Methanobacterium veterum TaxID=408577 RepID=A0A9E5DH04_9EURY|nr:MULTISPECIES: metallophosphoesterase [Methanobacterium]MCZ3365156.1 metallophosphoesterase [Methanobacterium veterum]MCZ3372911.1 metallophosphoesterase [Methanobacterium veterum]